MTYPIAKRLKELREQNKLTQAQVAQKLNITRNAYTMYETGANTPTLQALITLSELYHVSLDYLIGRY